ncbi:MAG: hypothetical protein QOI61_2116 [Actinomycetota bacterium]|jgi:hypothetical protein
MVGGFVVVLGLGAAVGMIGRLVMPGRHGLLLVALRDPKLLPRLLKHDGEIRWEVTAGVLGASVAYLVGRAYDSAANVGPSPTRWWLSAIGATVVVGIAVVSGVIERLEPTRRLGTRRRFLRSNSQ